MLACWGIRQHLSRLIFLAQTSTRIDFMPPYLLAFGGISLRLARPFSLNMLLVNSIKRKKILKKNIIQSKLKTP